MLLETTARMAQIVLEFATHAMLHLYVYNISLYFDTANIYIYAHTANIIIYNAFKKF